VPTNAMPVSKHDTSVRYCDAHQYSQTIEFMHAGQLVKSKMEFENADIKG